MAGVEGEEAGEAGCQVWMQPPAMSCASRVRVEWWGERRAAVLRPPRPLPMMMTSKVGVGEGEGEGEERGEEGKAWVGPRRRERSEEGERVGGGGGR